MKKTLISIFIFTILLTVVSFAGNNTNLLDEKQPVVIKLNGNTVGSKEVAPFIIKGTTMVPVRWVVENLGNEVGWDQDTYTVMIDTTTKDLNEINDLKKYIKSENELQVLNVVVNGVLLDEFIVNPILVNGTSYVPLRPLAKALNISIAWDENTKEVLLSRDVKETFINIPTEKTVNFYYDNERFYFDKFQPIIDENGEVYLSVNEIKDKIDLDIKKYLETNGELDYAEVGYNDASIKISYHRGEYFITDFWNYTDGKFYYNSYYDETYKINETKNNELYIPVTVLKEYLNMKLSHRKVYDVRADGEKRHVIDIGRKDLDYLKFIKNQEYEGLDKTNPFGEKIAYMDGNIFNFENYNLNEDGEKLTERDFTLSSKRLFNGYVDDDHMNAIQIWTPYNEMTGKGVNYGFYEGLDKLQEYFHEVHNLNGLKSGDIKYKDIPLYVINAEAGIIKYPSYLYVHDKTGQIWLPNAGNEYRIVPNTDVENWSYTIDRDFTHYTFNEFWHFGLSTYENTDVYFPRITIDQWYDFTHYAKGEDLMSTVPTSELETVKPLIQFWSNSYEDSKMIWRTLEYLIRGAAFPEDKTDEYTKIIENAKEGSILEYPDGTRIKLLNLYGQNTTSMAAEFLFMSMPFERDEFERDIKGLLD